jgi:hypothetical protein
MSLKWPARLRAHLRRPPERDVFRVAAEKLEKRAAALSKRPGAKAAGNDQVVLSLSDLVRALGLANSAATIFTVAIFTFTAMSALLVLQQVREARRTTLEQNDFTINSQFFGDPQNREIIADIEHGTPILTANGGKLDDVQLDMYLNSFETINNAVADNQLRAADMCGDFSHYINLTATNREIRKYIADQRKDDPRYYQGLDDLYSAAASSKDPYCHDYKPPEQPQAPPVYVRPRTVGDAGGKSQPPP